MLHAVTNNENRKIFVYENKYAKFENKQIFVLFSSFLHLCYMISKIDYYYVSRSDYFTLFSCIVKIQEYIYRYFVKLECIL